MDKVPGVNGKTFDVKVDIENGIVYIGDEIYTEGVNETHLFIKAYTMGRNHKKQEIKEALSL